MRWVPTSDVANCGEQPAGVAVKGLDRVPNLEYWNALSLSVTGHEHPQPTRYWTSAATTTFAR